MQLLGTVKSVRAATLVVSLPHNLTGFVPAIAVSALLGEGVASALEARANGTNDDASDAGALTGPRGSLEECFTPGQTVSCVVARLAPDASKRRIELSMLPERVNAGRPVESLAAKQVVVATVRSVEDHGYVMDTGIDGANAFMPFEPSAAGEGGVDSIEQPRLRPGDHVTCIVSSVVEASRTVRLSSDPEAVRKAQTKALPRKAAMPLSQVKPGMLANTRVLSVRRRTPGTAPLWLRQACTRCRRTDSCRRVLSVRACWYVGPSGCVQRPVRAVPGHLHGNGRLFPPPAARDTRLAPGLLRGPASALPHHVCGPGVQDHWTVRCAAHG